MCVDFTPLASLHHVDKADRSAIAVRATNRVDAPVGLPGPTSFSVIGFPVSLYPSRQDGRSVARDRRSLIRRTLLRSRVVFVSVSVSVSRLALCRIVYRAVSRLVPCRVVARAQFRPLGTIGSVTGDRRASPVSCSRRGGGWGIVVRFKVAVARDRARDRGAVNVNVSSR